MIFKRKLLDIEFPVVRIRYPENLRVVRYRGSPYAHMAGLSKKRVRLHQTASLAILAVYLAIATSVDLFHTEAYLFGDQHSGTASSIFSDTPCPACAFLAGHHSAGVSYTPALLDAERLFTSQSLPPIAVICCNEWAYSIISRAPPSTAIS